MSWRHADGELCFGKENYFVVVAQTPQGQITNHYKGEYCQRRGVGANQQGGKA